MSQELEQTADVQHELLRRLAETQRELRHAIGGAESQRRDTDAVEQLARLAIALSGRNDQARFLVDMILARGEH